MGMEDSEMSVDGEISLTEDIDERDLHIELRYEPTNESVHLLEKKILLNGRNFIGDQCLENRVITKRYKTLRI